MAKGWSLPWYVYSARGKELSFVANFIGNIVESGEIDKVFDKGGGFQPTLNRYLPLGGVMGTIRIPSRPSKNPVTLSSRRFYNG